MSSIVPNRIRQPFDDEKILDVAGVLCDEIRNAGVRFYKKSDFNATYENVLPSTLLERGRLPIVAEDIETGLKIALNACYSCSMDIT